MKKLLLLISVLIVLMACNKDKFQSTPQIKIKSVSSEIVPLGSGWGATLSFTDKEGDVDGSVFIRKVRLNKRFVAKTLFDTFSYKIPDFPSHSTGDININLDNNVIKSAEQPFSLPGGGLEPDSMLIWFRVTDAAGNKSDSVSTGMIVVLR